MHGAEPSAVESGRERQPPSFMEFRLKKQEIKIVYLASYIERRFLQLICVKGTQPL
jgi:hypothetical protein